MVDLIFLRSLHPSFFSNIHPLLLLTYLSSLQLQTSSLTISFHNVTSLLINNLSLPITIPILHFRYLHNYLFPLLFIFHITPPYSLLLLCTPIVCDRFLFNDSLPLYFACLSYYIFFKSPVLAAAPDNPPILFYICTLLLPTISIRPREAYNQLPSTHIIFQFSCNTSLFS